MLIWIVVALGELAFVYAGLVFAGAWCWSRSTAALIARLDAAQIPAPVTRHDAPLPADLPAPVKRYFDLALTQGQSVVRSVNVEMTGEFNLSLSAPNSKPFTSRQHVVTRRPGFVWEARMPMFPGVPVRVQDAYVAGEGLLNPSVLGLFSFGSMQGKGEIARGELMRWIAEAAWYPTALLPSQGVTWQAVDATSAQATLIDASLTLTLLFRFGSDGLVASVHANARSGTLEGVQVMMLWECRLSNYHLREGMRVPMTAEVLYHTPQGERPYFKGTVTGIAYQLAA